MIDIGFFGNQIPRTENQKAHIEPRKPFGGFDKKRLFGKCQRVCLQSGGMSRQ